MTINPLTNGLPQGSYQLKRTHCSFNFQFHLIGTDNIADLLVRNGANINALDKDEDTPLHVSALHGINQIIYVQ